MWTAVNTGLTDIDVAALAIDPRTPSTLYAGAGTGVFKSTDAGATWTAVNTGLTNIGVAALAIDPVFPTTLYAATGAGVFSIQQIAACVGDCDGKGSVSVDEIITLVNIVLGNAPPAACSNGGLPIGGDVDVAVIMQAVNHALNGCGNIP